MPWFFTREMFCTLRPRAVRGLVVVVILGVLSILVPVEDAVVDKGLVRSVRVTDRNGELLREIREDGRSRPVGLDEISPEVVAALVATEDSRFFSHPGVDAPAVLASFWDNLVTGEIVRGGSTLTMQVARMMRGRQNRGWMDKLAEIQLALRLDFHLSKEEILELWLNRAPFGNEAYGIESAARLYFGKPASDLHLVESALLVGIPQSPSRYDPFRHLAATLSRRSTVFDALESLGQLTHEKRQSLEQIDVQLADPEPLFRAPHFVQWVSKSSPVALTDVSEIRTTLDLGLQTQVENIVRSQINRVRGAAVTNASAVVLDNRTGEVLAYVGSADFWDDHAQGQVDGVQMLRQPGSTLKPFTYAVAMASQRYTPATILADIDTQIIEAGGAFSPDNYDKKFHGPVALKQALACSYNVPAIRMAREIGPGALLSSFRTAGLTSLNRSPDVYGVGITLGNGEVQLIELARAYSGLARGGTLPQIRNLVLLRDRKEQTIRPLEGGEQPNGISAQVAYLLSDILSDPVVRSPAFGRGSPLELPFPTAVKTGTSKDYRDNWIVGYTPRHTVAVWAGNFDGSPMQYVSGVSGAGPILNAIFMQLGSGGDFERPPGIVEAEYCPASGDRVGLDCPEIARGLFLEKTSPVDTCSVHTLIRTDNRTGLLADDSTPEQEISEQLYTVYPAVFHPWMRDNGLKFPPRVSGSEVVDKGGEWAYSDILEVVYPSDGTHYLVDPVLRREFQRVRFTGTAHETVYNLTWFVNNRPIPGDEAGARWTLVPGKHLVEMRAVTSTGDRIRSRPATLTVSDPNDGAGQTQGAFVRKVNTR